MRVMLVSMMALAAFAAAGRAAAADDGVTMRSGLTYAVHDGAKLVGDLYLPKTRSKAPALVAIHGGGWRGGSRALYQYWGRFLARHGYALFAIDYRLGALGTYPAAIYDVQAAIQYVRANASDFDIDPDRIGLIGDSAGGYFSALLALAGERFTTAYRDDPNAAIPIDVKAVVGFYGIYDMQAQWNHDELAQQKREASAQRNHDLIARRRDSITEDFLGVSPIKNRRIYFEASPISYATIDRKAVRFLLIHGSRDEFVDATSQTGAFYMALTQAGFTARQVIMSAAAHFWATDPFENEPGSYGAKAAPQVLQFLKGAL